MIPVVTIVGRPNVGKSTLFNCLTGTRRALVADYPGLTRDRQYGYASKGDISVLVVDTGGLVNDDASVMDTLAAKQVNQAVDEADILLFVVDAQEGLMPDDRIILERLRVTGKPIILALNKIDGYDPYVLITEFHELGMSDMVPIATKSNRGMERLWEVIVSQCSSVVESQVEIAIPPGIRVVFVGKPNVGKSTLLNRVLGEDRVVVSDQPGTTRDSVYVPFQRDGVDYTLIDTAGVRRRARVKDKIEKFSLLQTLQALALADVAVFVLNAHDVLSDQDQRLVSKAVEMGCGIVLAVNKWDNMESDQKDMYKAEIERRLAYVDYARRYFISAKHGTNVSRLFRAITEAHTVLQQEYSTSLLNEILTHAIEAHQPPLVKGRRVRLRYVHVGSRKPLLFIVHGKQVEALVPSYKRYIVNYFRKALKIVGVPLQVLCRNDDNPYV